MQDKVRKGRQTKGEQVSLHKLDRKRVDGIREEYAAGNISQTQLAKKNNVDQQTIWSIVHRRTWKD